MYVCFKVEVKCRTLIYMRMVLMDGKSLEQLLH